MMKLYGVALKDELPFENLAMAIWANSESEAVSHWRYLNNCENDDCVDVDHWACDVDAEPEKVGVHEESRLIVLKEAGWREEGDRECECCGQWSSDVSSEFGLCPECYVEEIGE